MHSLKNIIIKLFISFIFFSVFAVTNTYAQNKITSVRIWPSPESTRVVFDLKDKPDYSYFVLKKPLRLVVDLKNTSQKVSLPKVTKEHQLIKKVRFSKPKKKGWTRLVFEILEPVKPVIFSLSPTGPKKDRLVVDLFAVNKKPKKTIVAKNRDMSGNRDVVIAIDAGHGGEDPGSIGPSGMYEKKITLEISKRLAKLINNEKGMRAVMPRTGDYHVKLNTRTVRARKHKADFFISIHADAFTSPQPRGASVWVLSLRRANSEIGKLIEDSEKHSDLLGGAASVLKDTQNEKYLVQAVLDMKMDHSMKTGSEIAISVLNELKKVTKMHKTKPQYASLAVLKSPDIPSILVETGFISNPAEEKLLKSTSHQNKLAKAVFKSVKAHFRNNPPEDSYFAKIKPSTPESHLVKSGDSLSVLAQRYGVTVYKLKQANRLKSNTLFIGQNLTIPRS